MTLLRGRAGEGVDEGAWDDGVDEGEGGVTGGAAGKEGTWVWGLIAEEKLEGERGSRTNYNEER